MKSPKTAYSIGKNRQPSSYRRSLLSLLMQRLRSGLRFSTGYAFYSFSVILCLLSFAFLFSCSQPSPVREQLSRAEQVMETDSRAAALVLDSIDSSTLRGEEAALYAILRTQTDYKNYKPLTSDSLARIATDYYGTPLHKNYHAAMAWYTLGCVYSEKNDDINAINAYLQAIGLFPETTNLYFALAKQNLGIHYLNRQMLDDALNTFSSCKNQLIEAGDKKRLAYIDYYIALAFLYKEEFEKAKELFSDVWNNDNTSNFLKGEALLQLAKISLYDDKNYPETLNLVHRHIAFTDSTFMGVDNNMLGDIYFETARYDSAYWFYRQSLLYENEINTLCCNYKKLSETASLVGQTDSIASYVSSYTILLDSISEIRRTEEIASIQSKYLLETEQRRQSLHKRWSLAVFSFSIVLVSLLLFLWFIQRDRKRKSDYISLCDEVRQSKLKKYENIKETLDSCCSVFRMTAAFDMMTNIQTKQDFHVDKKVSNLIAHDINTCFASLRTSLKQEAPAINEKEFFYITCDYLGFDTNTTSFFLCSAYSTLTSMKSRLKKKMTPELYSLFFPKK